ncbi:MAG: hypothetical protein JNL42_08050 [Anaerolineae bacterium]|nr:hypothetical protein [Anaerolineae bacterium]
MYVVSGLPMREGERLRNVAVLINRKGELIGISAKRHPTEGEIGSGCRLCANRPDRPVSSQSSGLPGHHIRHQVDLDPPSGVC